MNKVILIGNLTRDPETGETNNGVAYGKFSIAVNRPYANGDGERQTDFFNITVWRGQAENCGKYLRKGSKVAVVGSLQNRSYEDRDGNKRNVTDIIANEVEFLSKAASNNDGYPEPPEEPRQASSGNARPTLQPIDDDEDLPF